MSRPSSPSGMEVAGRVALRMPSGDPPSLRARASGLMRIEAEASDTPLMRGAMAQQLPQVWAGATADTAVAESALLVRRATRMLEALPAASTALVRYAATLEQVRTRVARLQRQWDDEGAAHALALSATRSQAVIDVAAVSDRTFPSRAEPIGSTLRDRLFAGMAFAEGAVAVARSRQLALGDAASLRRVLGEASSGRPSASSPQALTDVVDSIRRRVDDPVYAQVVVDELGVNGIQGLLAELSRGDSGLSADELQGVTGLLGRLLLTATNPSTAALDPRTLRLVDSSSALLRDTVVASLGGGVVDSTGGEHYAAYWLMGQLVTGARRSGWTGVIAPGFLQRLVTATARAEVGETRDDDMGRQHGTTIAPHGSELFTSFFDDANRSGDALHVLLAEVGDDPVDQLELLNASFDGGILTDTRGGRCRWPGTSPDGS